MEVSIEILCRNIKSWINEKAMNVGNNYNSLPAPFKNGFTYTYYLGTLSGGKGNISVKMAKEYNNIHNQVATSTVDSQFNSYMSSKGFNVNDTSNISANRLFYFLNCVTAFITAKLVTVISDTNFAVNATNENVITDTGSKPGVRIAIMYDAINISYPSVSTYPNDSLSTVTVASYNKYVENLKTSLSSTLKCHQINYVTQGLVSSSSCSSSSCSSSCSAFIAHIN